MQRPEITVDDHAMRVPDHFHVGAWPDPLVERLGYRYDSRYYLTWWAPTLGPTATLLVFHLGGIAARLRDNEIATVDAADLSRLVGLGANVATASRHAPFARSMRRIVKFGVGRVGPAGDVLEIRRRVPMLNARQLNYLPASLQAMHAAQTRPDGHRAA